MSGFNSTSKTPTLGGNNNTDWDVAGNDFLRCYEKSVGETIQAAMPSVQPGLDGSLPLLRTRNHDAQNGLVLGLDEASFSRSSAATYLDPGSPDLIGDGIEAGLLFDSRKRTRSNSARHRYNEVVTELGPEEVRWFYKEDKKTWKSFVGHDSLKIEIMFRKFCESDGPDVARRPDAVEPQVSGEENRHANGVEGSGPVDNGAERTGPVPMHTRATDPDDGDPDNVEINIEAVCVRGGLYEVDIKERECYPVYWNQQDCIPVMRGQWFIDGTWLPLDEEESDLIEQEHLNCFRGQQMQDTFKSDAVVKTVDSHDASSSGTRLHRGYVEEASPEDRPPQTTHIVFVVHGIGQKMDQGRIIKNTGMLREAVRKMEEKHFSEHNDEHVEFLPVEWRSKLALDGDTVDSITPDKVRGLRDLLNSSAMDIMYYTSPLYRDEITKGLTQELNRLYSLFCSRNPEFEEKGGKVSIVSHSLGCVITFDIMTGWDPVRFCLQEHHAMEEELDLRWISYEERNLLKQLQITKNRLRELEDQLQGLEASRPSSPPALKFKVENFFCMGSPLAVFLALRGIRPGTSCHQDHILPTSICSRLFNVFHPTDPVAYRLEPLILKHYSNIAPVQIHWCSAINSTPYDEIRPTFLNPVKDPASDSESIPSPSTSPVLPRRHYGESITSLGKASILGAASIGKGIGGILFSRFSRSNSQPSSVSAGVEGVAATEGEEQKRTDSQSAYGLSTMTQSASSITDTSLELERRIDFELREGLVESRYWSAVTSHTGYWCSHDVALFLLTFIYKQIETLPETSEENLDPD
ncbi:phospholipase DDHD1 isoform X2 [Lampris incognitus]|uniref:phospholipase DDHD1 isoform X2 n=1 Tax=Lampris incognitus TaxID=2546036 RepID=UPI0024B4F01D|nr:phospholipase DDHD1 isoform X2 [Lampris incognitus]